MLSNGWVRWRLAGLENTLHLSFPVNVPRPRFSCAQPRGWPLTGTPVTLRELRSITCHRLRGRRSAYTCIHQLLTFSGPFSCSPPVLSPKHPPSGPGRSGFSLHRTCLMAVLHGCGAGTLPRGARVSIGYRAFRSRPGATVLSGNSLGLCREQQSPRLGGYRGLLQIFGFDYLTRRFQSPPEPPLVRGPSHLL